MKVCSCAHLNLTPPPGTSFTLDFVLQVIVGKYATPWEMRAKLDATLAEEEKIEAHALQVAEDRTAKEKKRRDRLKKLRLDEERYVSAL